MIELVIPAGTKKEIVLVHSSPETEERIIRLSGEGAEVHVDEIFLGSGVESRLSIMHDAPRTVSRIRTRGVVGKSQFVKAHAKIVIPRQSLLSDTFVSQKFLLLDESSQVDALPSLEIEADEVKASHSTAISPLSEDSVFYMKSRGIDDVEARKILIHGFLNIPKEYEHLAK